MYRDTKQRKAASFQTYCWIVEFNIYICWCCEFILYINAKHELNFLLIRDLLYSEYVRVVICSQRDVSLWKSCLVFLVLTCGQTTVNISYISSYLCGFSSAFSRFLSADIRLCQWWFVMIKYLLVTLALLFIPQLKALRRNIFIPRIKTQTCVSNTELWRQGFSFIHKVVFSLMKSQYLSVIWAVIQLYELTNPLSYNSRHWEKLCSISASEWTSLIGARGQQRDVWRAGSPCLLACVLIGGCSLVTICARAGKGHGRPHGSGWTLPSLPSCNHTRQNKARVSVTGSCRFTGAESAHNTHSYTQRGFLINSCMFTQRHSHSWVSVTAVGECSECPGCLESRDEWHLSESLVVPCDCVTAEDRLIKSALPQF